MLHRGPTCRGSADLSDAVFQSRCTVQLLSPKVKLRNARLVNGGHLAFFGCQVDLSEIDSRGGYLRVSEVTALQRQYLESLHLRDRIQERASATSVSEGSNSTDDTDHAGASPAPEGEEKDLATEIANAISQIRKEALDKAKELGSELTAGTVVSSLQGSHLGDADWPS